MGDQEQALEVCLCRRARRKTCHLLFTNNSDDGELLRTRISIPPSIRNTLHQHGKFHAHARPDLGSRCASRIFPDIYNGIEVFGLLSYSRIPTPSLLPSTPRTCRLAYRTISLLTYSARFSTVFCISYVSSSVIFHLFVW